MLGQIPVRRQDKEKGLLYSPKPFGLRRHLCHLKALRQD
ncbi:hypothetical protein LDG_5297 [Legionella drancourtii LLAP12]|uniref:Uncharacterized protein n=1 Tax=Legionella drancourtii LLAP12 TaxID=658187 RepID=G9EJD6_9GAMM|nr:hypothetical protein LDG_5297 [Legionella drancourtii LLAP12]